MTFGSIVAALQLEKQQNLPSRFPCRAIMVKNVSQYCQLLSELKRISDIRVVKAQEIFPSADVMPQYTHLLAEQYKDEWVILTGISEYLRLFSKREATDARFASLWKKQSSASSLGRIIIPLWGCEAQWFDTSLNLMGDVRQHDHYYNCIDMDQPEQVMNLLVLSNLFEPHLSDLKKDGGTLCVGLQEWFEYWENPSSGNTNFVLLTKRINSITPVSGRVNIDVMTNSLSFIRNKMDNGDLLTSENCTDEMQKTLFTYALHGVSLDEAILRTLNISFFSGTDIMRKWGILSASTRHFVSLWYQLHPESSYLCHCFATTHDIENIEYSISHEIFQYRMNKPDWVKEYKLLTSVMVMKPDPAYFCAVDAIDEYEDRLDFITGKTKEERVYLLKMVGQWMRKDPEQVNSSTKLQNAFPELAAYLSQKSAIFHDDIDAYFSRYKAHKLENSLPIDEDLYFNGVDPDVFGYRYSVLSEYVDENTIVIWIDALGAEWLSLLRWSLERSCNGIIKHVEVVQATLPTETRFNEQWNEMGVTYKKLNKLDKLAHKGVIDEPDYYACIEEQIEFVSQIGTLVDKMLETNHRIIITGDHGTSRLAARFFHEKDGIDVPKDATAFSHGRYCKMPIGGTFSMPDVQITQNGQGERFVVFRNYNHFKQSGFATGAGDSVAIYGEIHGGATPEEMLVPVVVIDSKQEIPLTATWEKDTVKISMKKAKLHISFNRSVSQLHAKMAGTQGKTTFVDSKTWIIEFANVKAGKYTIEIVADNHIVDMPPITLLSALGGGEGDLLW